MAEAVTMYNSGASVNTSIASKMAQTTILVTIDGFPV
jgi:hypothetical protein